ncbi:TniB family NTP-binding protein [Stenotrophomonas bentonitica]
MKAQISENERDLGQEGAGDPGAQSAPTNLLAFVPHPSAVRVLKTLSWLRRHQAGLDRPKCLHLAAEAGMGKSRLLRHYVLQRTAENSASGLRRREVVLVDAPFDGHHAKFARSLIDACLPGYSVNRASRVYDSALTLMAASGVRQVLIDEAGNFLNAGRATQQQTLAFLKAISNRGITVCIATTRNMANVLAADEQLHSRFNRAELPQWSESREFRLFLAGVERAISLPAPSHLDSMAVVRWLLLHDVSTTARVVELTTAAAGLARQEGLPCLTVQVLDRVRVLDFDQRGNSNGHR